MFPVYQRTQRRAGRNAFGFGVNFSYFFWLK